MRPTPDAGAVKSPTPWMAAPPAEPSRRRRTVPVFAGGGWMRAQRRGRQARTVTEGRITAGREAPTHDPIAEGEWILPYRGRSGASRALEIDPGRESIRCRRRGVGCPPAAPHSTGNATPLGDDTRLTSPEGWTILRPGRRLARRQHKESSRRCRSPSAPRPRSRRGRPRLSAPPRAGDLCPSRPSERRLSRQDAGSRRARIGPPAFLLPCKVWVPGEPNVPHRGGLSTTFEPQHTRPQEQRP